MDHDNAGKEELRTSLGCFIMVASCVEELVERRCVSKVLICMTA
jgi:hypothetical protein